MARILFALLLVTFASADVVAAKPGLGWRDLVQVRKVFSPAISDDGSWIALEARPDRGDGEVVFREVDGNRTWSIARGKSPILSADGRWGAAVEQPPFEERETSDEPDTLKSFAVLVDLESGEQIRFESPEEFAFSADGKWFAVRVKAPEEEEEAAEDESVDEAEGEAEPEEEPELREAGTPLTVIRLEDGERWEFEDVTTALWSGTGAWLALVQETESGLGNQLSAIEFADSIMGQVSVSQADSAAWDAVVWAEELPLLAAVEADARDPEDPVDATLIECEVARGETRRIARADELEMHWTLPLDNRLSFSRDGQRLYFGMRESEDEPSEEEAGDFDLLDVDTLLDERGLDVWHWQDPRIKTNEKSSFEDRSKHLFLAVVHRDTGAVVRVSGPETEDVARPDEGTIALGKDPRPYLRERTWDGWYEDVWAIDLTDGTRTPIATRVQDTVSRSPKGAYVLWFADEQFYLYETATADSRVVAGGLEVSFANEDHDYPRAAPDYGIGGWLRDESAVLLYDKYDVWLVPTDGGAARNLTNGRAERRTYRVVDLHDGPEGLDPAADLLLTGFDELAKNSSIWTVDLAGENLERRREDDRYYSVRAKAKNADRYLYSEEAYDVFYDLWVADGEFRKPKQLTDLNPQLEDFDLGEATLVDWVKDDGTPMQGILILPAGYEEGEQYPVLVYYYRFFTQRLHRFNDPVINHRPSFYAYAGDGYAVFLPDIRFEVGYPGDSAARSLIPGVQKIIDLGVADPGAIALHGHSWSGYQTAQIVTMTDMFACAVAGAPVSNMTSAYGGIRWGSGLSRQFQYEKSQSRIGATLWERRDLYIDNSPVFFADRINTPLLMQFGDEDEAVPWTQGIEMYMAMRRLGKPSVMLQYRGEPHHLKQYPNKLDYTLKMKAFIDHFCKGAPAPDWWTEGVEYSGD